MGEASEVTTEGGIEMRLLLLLLLLPCLLSALLMPVQYPSTDKTDRFFSSSTAVDTGNIFKKYR